MASDQGAGEMNGAPTRRDLQASALGLLAGPALITAGRPPARRHLRVAAAQMRSAAGDIAGNLARATGLAETAARQGAELVLFPEFMSTGYDLNEGVWAAAERRSGPTARWMARTSRRLRVWMGATYLEADGDDFFNTFVLTDPQGREAGRVRKTAPAGLEAYFFKGEAGPHVIDTALGRIGVGVCFESYLCALAERFDAAPPDLILLPHSYPDLASSGGIASPPGDYTARWHALRYGCPVVMVNKVGAWATATTFGPAAGTFPGRSAIVDADGATLVLMGADPGTAVRAVRLGGRSLKGELTCRDGLIAALAPGGDAGPQALAAAGAKAYAANPRRAAAARAVAHRT